MNLSYSTRYQKRAFPSSSEDSSEGMTLREYFAAKALQGMLASPGAVDRTKVDKAKWSRIAMAWADALLNELALDRARADK